MYPYERDLFLDMIESHIQELSKKNKQNGYI